MASTEHPPAPQPRRRPRPAWLIPLVFFTATGLLLFAYRYLDVLARGGAESPAITLIEELTGVWGVALLMPGVFSLARYARVSASRWWLHLPGVLLFSLLHTSWNWVSRVASFAAGGLGSYDYGRMPLRYLMELPSDMIGYALLVGFILLMDEQRAAQARQLRLAELEAEVAGARLQALEAQLQPHFLFNALNTISATMFEDVERADQMMAKLGLLLRRTLEPSVSGEVTLAHECETLQLYCALLEARFGDRLQVMLSVPKALMPAHVPHLLLQLLVENAVKHGAPPDRQLATIHVRAERRGEELLLEVHDNGPGMNVPLEVAMQRGLGLANTNRRLQRLHQTLGILEVADVDTGCAVRIRIPYHV